MFVGVRVRVCVFDFVFALFSLGFVVRFGLFVAFPPLNVVMRAGVCEFVLRTLI